ncbi:hypothetical protein B0H13DRAFT_2346745 [Mycena leptocephala]|nr:hypothetical protein B0H13DRAFT_2346745 [Mycena leptocephala]
MLSLPIPGHPPLQLTQDSKDLIEQARKANLDGTSDATAAEFPDHFTSAECEIFLEFIFNILPWTKDTPNLERLCALLKTCEFFAVESGTQYAVHYLDNHPNLGPALRYKLASAYNIPRWARRAFREMMSGSILELSEVEEMLLGWPAYRTLVRTHAEVAHYRLTLALFPPDVIHADFCYNKDYCERRWGDNWVGLSGGLGPLLVDELSGAVSRQALGRPGCGGTENNPAGTIVE